VTVRGFEMDVHLTLPREHATAFCAEASAHQESHSAHAYDEEDQHA